MTDSSKGASPTSTPAAQHQYEQPRIDYVIDAAISRLRSVDRDLKNDGWRIGDNSTREKIKHFIRELEQFRTATPMRDSTLPADLPRRLRTKADMIQMGEGIAFGSDSAIMREAADYIERMLERESGWVPYPAKGPRMYEHMPVSYPLLFVTHDEMNGTYVRQGYYHSDDRCFYESGDPKKLPWEHTVTQFYHYPLPSIDEQGRRG